MHLPDKQETYVTTISHQLRGLTDKFLHGLSADGDGIRLENTSDLLASQPPTRLFLIKSGQLHSLHNRKLVYIAEAGDLVGLSRSMQLPEGPLHSDGPVEVIPYQLDALMRHVHSSDALQRHWTYYLISLYSFFRECLAQEIPNQFKPATGFLQFDEGDTIIQQGEEAECVYTMLEGKADAIRDTVKVGEIHAEEIFGAMAVFTGQPRNATVKATDNCSVLAVRKDEFLDLVAHQPQVCLSLVEEMAEKINQLNRQVLDLQK
ncbi:MAG: cyclic nucleotide-binding domain-containing protein [Cellvibrionaceae bacterium]